MPCSTYRYKHTHEESLIEARHGRIEAFCSLTGVTGLTGPPDRSDRSRPANYKSEMMESRSSQICHQGVNASSSISGGHVLQAVRNSSTISFHNLFMCFVTKL